MAELALEAGTVSFDFAQKFLASDQRKFELGAETNFFVLDSETKLAQAELTLLQTQTNYQVTRAAVGHATGRLLEPYYLKIRELSKQDMKAGLRASQSEECDTRRRFPGTDMTSKQTTYKD